MELHLTVLPDAMAVCRAPAGSELPDLEAQPFFALTRTPEEISLVIRETDTPAGWRVHGGWRCLKVAGPLDFNLTGVLASLVAPLAQAEISVFAISTYDTDYLLVPAGELPQALRRLSDWGHRVAGE